MHFLLHILPFLMVHQSKRIENINIPSCRNCIHYKPYFSDGYSSNLAKCEAFGRKNILTNEINYEYADLCRDNETKCGLQGKSFEEEPNVELKIFKHDFLRNSPISILIITYMYLLFSNK